MDIRRTIQRKRNASADDLILIRKAKNEQKDFERQRRKRSTETVCVLKGDGEKEKRPRATKERKKRPTTSESRCPARFWFSFSATPRKKQKKEARENLLLLVGSRRFPCPSFAGRFPPSAYLTLTNQPQAHWPSLPHPNQACRRCLAYAVWN